MVSIHDRISQSSRQGAIPTSIALAFSLAACTGTIDASKLETVISEGLLEQTALVTDTVTCPEDQEFAQGDVFFCNVTLEGGQSFDVEVTQEDDQGNVFWSADEGLQSLEGLISNQLLEEQIAQGIQEQLQLTTTVDCGGKYRVALKGETFSCTVTDEDGNSRPAQIVANDNQGNVSWEY